MIKFTTDNLENLNKDFDNYISQLIKMECFEEVESSTSDIKIFNLLNSDRFSKPRLYINKYIHIDSINHPTTRRYYLNIKWYQTIILSSAAFECLVGFDQVFEMMPPELKEKFMFNLDLFT